MFCMVLNILTRYPLLCFLAAGDRGAVSARYYTYGLLPLGYHAPCHHASYHTYELLSLSYHASCHGQVPYLWSDTP